LKGHGLGIKSRGFMTPQDHGQAPHGPAILPPQCWQMDPARR